MSTSLKIAHASRCRLIAAALCCTSTAGLAIPPPPVPPGRIEASVNIANVAGVLEGAWLGRERGPGNHELELRVGHFGDSVTTYILIGRIVHVPQGVTGATDLRISYVSALVYAAACHGFEIVSLDRLGDARTGGCNNSFPIRLAPDGSVNFEYSDGNSQRVRVAVNNREWRESRTSQVGTQVFDSGFVAKRIGGRVEWGDLH